MCIPTYFLDVRLDTVAIAFLPYHELTLSRSNNLSHFTCWVTWLTSHLLLLQIRSARSSRATLACKQSQRLETLKSI